MTDYYLKYKKYKSKYIEYKKQIGGKDMEWSKNNYVINSSKSNLNNITAIYSKNDISTEYTWEDIKESVKNNNKIISANVDSEKYIWKINNDDYGDIAKNDLLIDVEIDTNSDKLQFLHFLKEDKLKADKIKANEKQQYNNPQKMLFSYIDNDAQIQFISENYKILNELTNNCFPSNIEKFSEEEDKNVEEIHYTSRNDVRLMLKHKTCFFALYDQKIVGYCFIGDGNVFENVSEVDIAAYEIIKKDSAVYTIYKNNMENKIIYPYIYNLCKDFSYNKIGSFLLDNIYNFLKSYSTYSELYLTAGSSKYQYYKDKCKIDIEHYTKSNKELVKYYENNNFKITTNYYTVYECGDGDIMFLNVLCREI